MRRRLLNLLTVLSLLLCVAAVVLWVSSYWASLSVGHRLAEGREPVAPGEEESAAHVYRQVWVGVALGRFDYGWARSAGDALDPSEVGWNLEAAPTAEWAPGDTFLEKLGFSFYWEAPLTHVVVPAWAVAGPAAVLPAVALRRLLRRWRDARRGRCRRCGYDLRATPGRCPECGSAA